MARDRTVMGRDLPGPRLTPAGWRLAALWVLPPALAILAAADLIGWAIIGAAFGVCFGLVCLF
jgi:hypothetical protein